MTEMTIVWEANANVPQVFWSEADATKFRNSRINRDRVKHAVYIRTIIVPDQKETTK